MLPKASFLALAVLACSTACAIGNTDRTPLATAQCFAANLDTDFYRVTVPATKAEQLFLEFRDSTESSSPRFRVYAGDGRLVEAVEPDRLTRAYYLQSLRPGTYTLIADMPKPVTTIFRIEPGHSTLIGLHVAHPKPVSYPPSRRLRRGVLLSYISRGCHGPCPNFRVTVFEDGWVHWFGRFHVRARGPRVGRLTPQALAALRRHLACLAPLPSAYEGHDHDLPWILHFRQGDRSLEFEIGDKNSLFTKRLANRIHHTLGIRRWISPKQR